MSGDEIAIRIEDLSKCYMLYDRPEDRLKQSIVPRLQRLAGRTPTKYFREFWALKNVSFEIEKGETVGIIGRNGSGKSTLLQIICGTLFATSGSVESKGRIAALLELGSGFNPEFTGRENVYMNGAILGLSKNEIDARFDSIAAFADIGDFIDQPQKCYSSGMSVRLAFAVIAHVDADILVIDEALAVGDAFFVQKCMRFLRRFMERGTVLFVSHDTASVINFCRRVIWLQEGRVERIGAPKEVANSYLRAILQNSYGSEIALQPTGAENEKQEPEHVEPGLAQREAEPGTLVHIFDNRKCSAGWQTGAAEIVSVQFVDSSGNVVASFEGGERVNLVIRARAHRDMFSPILGFFVKDRLGQSLFGEHTFTYLNEPLSLSAGAQCEARFRFDIPMLPNGDYAMTVSIAEGTPWEHVQHHWLHDALIFKVASNKLRYGLVGIPFRSVSMDLVQ
jgi:lipopolysaccharide transport system ATP-binding protein